jgi:hypothetical protein
MGFEGLLSFMVRCVLTAAAYGAACWLGLAVV